MNGIERPNNGNEEKPGCFQVGLVLALTFGGSTLGFAATIMLIGSQISPEESVQLADIKGLLLLGSFVEALIGIFASLAILPLVSND